MILCVLALCATSRTAAAAASCPVTIPAPGWKPSGPDFGPGRFSFGSARLRASLFWPKGILSAGTLPNGGSMAVRQRDGSIRLKLGWWRGVPGGLVITGRRLDRPGRPLRAAVPPNESYGDTGFIPSDVVFPTTGCWRVTGEQGRASLTFVVEVVKIPPLTR